MKELSHLPKVTLKVRRGFESRINLILMSSFFLQVSQEANLLPLFLLHTLYIYIVRKAAGSPFKTGPESEYFSPPLLLP